MESAACKRIFSEIDALTDNDVENNKEILQSIYEALKKKLKTPNKDEEKEEEENEQETLKRYILDEWQNCDELRGKIDWEGLDYFYNSYTSVPVSWETYTAFVISEDCFCGECVENK